MTLLIRRRLGYLLSEWRSCVDGWMAGRAVGHQDSRHYKALQEKQAQHEQEVAALERNHEASWRLMERSNSIQFAIRVLRGQLMGHRHKDSMGVSLHRWARKSKLALLAMDLLPQATPTHHPPTHPSMAFVPRNGSESRLDLLNPSVSCRCRPDSFLPPCRTRPSISSELCLHLCHQHLRGGGVNAGICISQSLLHQGGGRIPSPLLTPQRVPV